MAAFIFLANLFFLECILDSRIRLMGVYKCLMKVSFSPSVTPKSSSLNPLQGTCLSDEASERVNCIWAKVLCLEPLSQRTYCLISSLQLSPFEVLEYVCNVTDEFFGSRTQVLPPSAAPDPIWWWKHPHSCHLVLDHICLSADIVFSHCLLFIYLLFNVNSAQYIFYIDSWTHHDYSSHFAGCS